MDVRVYATLRPIIGGPKASLDIEPGNTFQQLLDEMIARWPDLTRELYDSKGQLHTGIHVFLNGRDVRYLGGLDMPIPEDGESRIFPPVGGGSHPPADAGPIQVTHEYHGVPQWLMKEYLTDLGAAPVDNQTMAGDGWQAVISKAEPNRIGSLVVGGAAVEFTGPSAVLDALFAKLHWKTLRGGG